MKTFTIPAGTPSPYAIDIDQPYIGFPQYPDYVFRVKMATGTYLYGYPVEVMEYVDENFYLQRIEFYPPTDADGKTVDNLILTIKS